MWDKSYFETLDNYRKQSALGGGQSRIDTQHQKGKLTARERLDLLFDSGTFHELDDLIQSRCADFGMDQKRIPGDGVVTGYGKINGRPAFASSQDFTVNGGSLGEYQAKKICRIMDMALEMKAPYISINDSGGARIEEGIDSLSGYGDIFYRNTRASGVIPQISVIMGPCAGGACYSPAISDFIFMVRGSGLMFITGPDVVKTVTGEDIASEALGGAALHSAESGVAHFVYDDDQACLNGVRQLLTYLPQHADDELPYTAGVSTNLCRGLQKVVSDNQRKCYDIKAVIGAIVDKYSFFEIQTAFARNAVIGLARIDGSTVGVVANQSNWLGGSLDINASDKIARFVSFCDCFGIPLLTLVDVPAFLPGSDQEKNGIIRHGAKILYAYSEATVPKVTVILRKAYGGAYIAMCSRGLGADVVYAWPIAQIAVMGPSGAVGIIFKKQINSAEDEEAEKARLVNEYNEKFMNPYIAAARGYVDEVIMPEETRDKISAALEMLKTKNKPPVQKRRGNMPV